MQVLEIYLLKIILVFDISIFIKKLKIKLFIDIHIFKLKEQ